MNRLFVLALVIISLWPVWVWYIQRLIDNSDEPLGIVALATAVSLAIARKDKSADQPAIGHGKLLTPNSQSLILCMIALAVYGLNYHSAPNLVLAVIGVLAVGFSLNATIEPRRLSAGYWLLLFLSLPLVATLNFYIGYPLRLVASSIAAPMLAITGFDVAAHGTSLQWQSHMIEIDAPCSGIKMLWLSLYLSATMACVLQMNLPRTVVLAAGAVVAALFANVLRVTSLFYVESGVIKIDAGWHEFVHQGTGVAAFALLAVGIVYFAFAISRRLRGDDRMSLPDGTGTGEADSVPCSGGDAMVLPGRADKATSVSCLSDDPSQLGFRENYRAPGIVLLCLCLVNIFVPFFPKATTAKPSMALNAVSEDHFTWPVEFEGHPLREVPPSAVNARFISEFPGKIRVCTDGERTIVMRWLSRPTRQLHPASDCYRASGYSIDWMPMHVDAEGKTWSTFEAREDKHTLRVREIIRDRTGSSWTDPSSWYWSAMFNRTSAPWFTTTVAEEVD